MRFSKRVKDIPAIDGQKRTPLYKALSRGHAKLARVLIDYGADVLAIDNNGQTPLS
jgi:ankyrin repeat protein